MNMMMWRRRQRGSNRIQHPAAHDTVIHLSHILLACDRSFLLSYVQEKQLDTPITEIRCDLMTYNATVGPAGGCDPLLAVIQSIPTLECVVFRNKQWRTNLIEPYLEAVSQNDAIHTIKLENIHCTPHILRTLLQRKRRLVFLGPCRLVNPPPVATELVDEECDSHVACCDLQEIDIHSNGAPHIATNVLECIECLGTLPSLRALYISSMLLIEGFYDNGLCTRLANVLQMSPLIEEFHLQCVNMLCPNMFSSLATTIHLAPCPHLTWHLHDCPLTHDTVPIFEEMVSWDHAKPMRLTIGPYIHMDKPIHEFMRNILQGSSSVTRLAYWSRVENIEWEADDDRLLVMDGRIRIPLRKRAMGDRGLDQILQTLEGRRSGGSLSSCPIKTIELYMDSHFESVYHDLLQSIPKWTSSVQTMRFGCTSHQQLQVGHRPEDDKLFPNDRICRGFLKAVQNNLHLRSVELDDKAVRNDDSKNKKIRQLLQQYCERNRMLAAALDKSYTIPPHLWPFILRIVSRGGPDSLYGCLLENAAYVLKGSEYQGQPEPQASLHINTTTGAASSLEKPKAQSRNRWCRWTFR